MGDPVTLPGNLQPEYEDNDLFHSPSKVEHENEEDDIVNSEKSFKCEIKNFKNVQKELLKWGSEVYNLKRKLSREDYDNFLELCNRLCIITERAGTRYDVAEADAKIYERIEKIEQSVAKLAVGMTNGQNAKKSFAEVVQLPTRRKAADAAGQTGEAATQPTAKPTKTEPKVRKITPKENVLIVKPENETTDEKQSSENIRKILKKNISREQNLKIKKAVNVRGGGLLLVLDPKTEKDKFLSNKILQENEIKVSEPLIRKPKVIIYNVCSDMEINELTEEIYERNFPLMDKNKFCTNFKPKFKLGPKNEKTVHWVIECSGEIRKEMINKQRILIDWNSCRVRDYTAVSRCFKCQKLNHVSKHCPDSQSTCAHCAVKGHDIKECPNKEKSPCCTNCSNNEKNHNHKANDKDCPTYRKALQQIIDKTDYGI